jgi:hypothetical protein
MASVSKVRGACLLNGNDPGIAGACRVCSRSSTPVTIRKQLINREVDRLRAQYRDHLFLDEENLMQSNQERKHSEVRRACAARRISRSNQVHLAHRAV